MRDLWTHEEQTRLKQLYDALPRTKTGRVKRGALRTIISTFPNRSNGAVRAWLELIRHPERIAVRRHQYLLWSAKDDRALKRLYKTAPWRMREEAKELFPNRTLGSVYMRARTLGIARSEMPEIRFRLSQTEAAFAAGLILGDGYITCTAPPSRPHIKTCSIGFVNSDRALVEWFQRIPRGNFSESDQRGKPGPIPHKRICYRWQCADKATLRQLVRYLRPYMLGEKRGKLELLASELGVET